MGRTKVGRKPYFVEMYVEQRWKRAAFCINVCRTKVGRGPYFVEMCVELRLGEGRILLNCM